MPDREQVLRLHRHRVVADTESRRQAVCAYTSAVVGCSPDDITAVSRFEDGNRHAVYRVSYLDGMGALSDVVVRVSYSGGEAERAHAEREASVLEVTGGVAAPVLHDFRCSSPWFDTPVMCMAHVPGRQIDLTAAPSVEIERLGSLVAWVHGCPTDGVVGQPAAPASMASYAEGRLESILSTLSWVRDPVPHPLQAGLRTAADEVERQWEAVRETDAFRTGEMPALLHGDVAPGNILRGRDPVLIDWEYTRLGDPADEIAYLFDQNGLSPPRREAFWRGYRGHQPNQEPLGSVVQRVDWWEPVTLLSSALWWVERWVRRTEGDSDGRVDPDVPRDAAYYLSRATMRSDRLEDLLGRR